MASSEARIQANRRNAQLSSGPKTEAGKEKSRANALKHGLTGAGVVMPSADAAEVERRSAAFAEETDASGEIGLALARLAALNSVRMERAADQQTAALSERVRQVDAEFVPPEGVSPDEAAKLRDEALRRAMFDPSKEATLARKYEAAAERNFFRALKELRQTQRQARVESPAAAATIPPFAGMMGSFSEPDMTDEEFDSLCVKLGMPLPPERRNLAPLPPPGAGFDLPITVGRRR